MVDSLLMNLYSLITNAESTLILYAHHRRRYKYIARQFHEDTLIHIVLYSILLKICF